MERCNAYLCILGIQGFFWRVQRRITTLGSVPLFPSRQRCPLPPEITRQGIKSITSWGIGVVVWIFCPVPWKRGICADLTGHYRPACVRAFSHRAKTLLPFSAAFSEPLTGDGQLENALNLTQARCSTLLFCRGERKTGTTFALTALSDRRGCGARPFHSARPF